MSGGDSPKGGPGGAGGAGGAGAGAGGGGGGGDAGSTAQDCASIFERTILASPVPDVLRQLQPGQVLVLTFEGPQGPLYASTQEGARAGSITSAALTRIIRCITEGFAFVAVVITVSGGRCDVEIRPAGS